MSALQKSFKSDTIILYVYYEKGDETSCRILCKSKNADIPEDLYFADSYLDSSNVVQQNTMDIVDSGTYKIPIEISLSAEVVQINIELVGAGVGGGTVRIWACPSLTLA